MSSDRLQREDLQAAWGFLALRRRQGPPPLNGVGYHGITREQYSESYQSWARGGRAWNRLERGGTDIMNAICWYQHIHRPGSKEWRPSIIIRAVVEAGHAAESPPAGTPATRSSDNSHPANTLWGSTDG